jgi:hypothetical protein
MLGLRPCISSQFSSISINEKTQHDVFVSFRGKDIRGDFLSHLIEAFRQKKVKAFVDDELKRGDEIPQSLIRGIQGSLISLIIFSQDYASSCWCLEELVTILQCREKYGQIVIPIFYQVDPTDVRYQKKSYENAFSEHERVYSSTKVQIWRHALNKSANLSGIKSSDFRKFYTSIYLFTSQNVDTRVLQVRTCTSAYQMSLQSFII